MSLEKKPMTISSLLVFRCLKTDGNRCCSGLQTQMVEMQKPLARNFNTTSRKQGYVGTRAARTKRPLSAVPCPPCTPRAGCARPSEPTGNVGVVTRSFIDIKSAGLALVAQLAMNEHHELTAICGDSTPEPA